MEFLQQVTLQWRQSTTKDCAGYFITDALIGYKFNIFYPDLIDKSSTPNYSIIKEEGNDETVIIKFVAGPPYEEAAFRIVNKEWEYGHKRGFRSSFVKGILKLHFRFKKIIFREPH